MIMARKNISGVMKSNVRITVVLEGIVCFGGALAINE
jgi:hypothetical protein